MMNLSIYGGKQMMKRMLLVLLALTLVVSMVAFVACGEEEEPVEEWQWPESLVLVTMSTRSPNYGSLVAWTTAFGEDVPTKFRVITESDTRLFSMWTKEGRIRASSPHQNRSMFYVARGFGRRDWGPYESRIWMPAGISSWGPVVLGTSDIKTVYDIKPGTKTTVVTTAEEPQQSIVGVIRWANLDPEDIVWIPMSSPPLNARFLLDGKSDLTYTYHTTASWYEVEASPYGLRWLPLDFENDPEGAERFLSVYPWTGFDYATGGLPTSEGVPMALGISPYITSAETDEELIYRMVKWLDENYDRYKEGGAWAATMTMENLMEIASYNYEPIHDGSVRYLEEIGLWTEELEAKRQFNIEQMKLWVDAYQAAIAMADDRGIDVNPDNEEWIELWENYRASQKLPLLVYYQEEGKAQPSYASFYDYWETLIPQY
jgi:hypothetical protein